MADARRNQLYVILNDPTLYSYYLPKDIKQLILDYLSVTTLVFGENDYNQLGFVTEQGDSSHNIANSTELSYDLEQIAFAKTYTLALTKDGHLLASGLNGRHELGLTPGEVKILTYLNPSIYDNNKKRSSSFINITILKQLPYKIIKIACNSYDGFVLTDDGKGYQVNGSLSDIKGNWLLIADNIIDIVAYTSACLLLTRDQRLLICGQYTDIDQKLLNVIDVNIHLKELIGYPNITKIFGMQSAFGFISNGYLYMCGANNSNKLGLSGTMANTYLITEPVMISDDTDSPIIHVQKVVGGSRHTLILTDIGLYGCGYGNDGQFGSNELKQINSFKLIIPNSNQDTINDIAADDTMSLIVINNVLYITGDNKYDHIPFVDRYIKTFTRISFVDIDQKDIKDMKVTAGHLRVAVFIYK
jgi:alpha-tubulin suppressor-like RCC1 family protein